MAVISDQGQILQLTMRALNQIIFVEKSSIEIESFDTINIINYVQSGQNIMHVVIGEINPLGWIWIMATWVTYIQFMFAFLANSLKERGILLGERLYYSP